MVWSGQENLFQVFNFALIYIVVSPLSNQPNLFVCFASEHSWIWLHSKKQKEQTAGYPGCLGSSCWRTERGEFSFWSLSPSVKLLTSAELNQAGNFK